jgi:hypothetical protein
VAQDQGVVDPFESGFVCQVSEGAVLREIKLNSDRAQVRIRVNQYHLLSQRSDRKREVDTQEGSPGSAGGSGYPERLAAGDGSGPHWSAIVD